MKGYILGSLLASASFGAVAGPTVMGDVEMEAAVAGTVTVLGHYGNQVELQNAQAEGVVNIYIGRQSQSNTTIGILSRTDP